MTTHRRSAAPARTATRIWPALALLCLCLALNAQAKPPAKPRMAILPAPVEAALRQAELPPDALAAVVMPAAGLGPRWLHQAERPMQPASTMKVVTSVVALDRLGPNHRGFTELLSAATVDGDVLRGDLVLRGGADPELGLPQLWALLAELRWQGVREIAGDIVIDRHLFRPARMDLGVPPFDEWPESRYNVIPDALHLTESLMTLELDSTAADGKARARVLPPLPGIRIDTTRMTISERSCRRWDDDWQSPAELVTDPDGSLRITLRSGYPRGCLRREPLQLIDRDVLAEHHLRYVWQSLGGTWSGQLRTAEQASAAGGATRVLARRTSRPWGELLRHQNKTSDNAWTRLLFLQLGVPAMASAPGHTTAELAAQEVTRWFNERRIPSEGLVMDNGSGLSHQPGADGRAAQGLARQRVRQRAEDEPAHRGRGRHHERAPEGQPGRRPGAAEDRHPAQCGGPGRLRARRPGPLVDPGRHDQPRAGRQGPARAGCLGGLGGAWRPLPTRQPRTLIDAGASRR